MESLVMRQHLEKISEPWFMNKVVAVVGALAMAVTLGWLAASGQLEMLIIVAVWVVAALIIVFVRDYWWAPAIVVTALALQTRVVGFSLTGLEVGMVFVGLTFPVKLAMKTLWPAKPKMDPGLFFWALLAFVVVHGVVIFFYSKIEVEPGIKNIVRCYYSTIAPLVLYGMLIRYCEPKTVFRTVTILFGIWIFTTLVALFVFLTGRGFSEITDLRITVSWLDPDNSFLFMRGTGPSLFITSMAFWPAARSTRYRFLLAFAGMLGIGATLLSGGRGYLITCMMAAAFFAAVRKRFWLALPVIVVVALTAWICTMKPELLYSLPDTIQRALTPLNFSEQKTEVQNETAGSDEWHEELREDSIPYWTYDTNSFWLGHGYKGWDESLNNVQNADYELKKAEAIQMGATENMFSSVTNIFGLAGMILYSGFLLQLAARLWKGRNLSPERSVERSTCEFSFVNLVTVLAVAPWAGGVPGINLVYFALGILAARPYLGEPEPAETAPVFAFDRSKRAVPVRSAFSHRDPLAEFTKRQAPLRFERKRSTVR